jgi:signal recognition particle subunit SRP54
MTLKERANPDILTGSRKRRIAAGSGRTVPEVNRLLKQFDEMRRMMKGMMAPGGKKKLKKMGMGNMPFFQ